MKNIGLGLVLAAGFAVPAAAQDTALNPRVATALETYAGGKYVRPECEALDDTGHFKVSSGRTYLQTAIEKGQVAENRDRQLRDAVRVITEAIVQNDRGESPSAWYFLGRAYLHRGDVAGADTALSRAERLAPQCAEEIGILRRVAFAPVINAGIDSMKAERHDAALRLFREAGSIFPSAPEPLYYQATLLYNAGKVDSAIPLFKATLERAGSDTARQQMMNQARFYYGYALLQQKRPQEALPVLEAYAQQNPDDTDGKKLLVNAYRTTGQPEKAAAIERELVQQAGETGALDQSDLFAIGVARFQEKNYDEAADAFSKVLEQEPNNRDALFNLANTRLVQADAAGLVSAAKRLVALDPMNERALQLLGEGYRLSKQQDSLIKVVERLAPMPVSIDVQSLSATDQGAKWVANAVGRSAQSVSGRPVPPSPVAITVEFLNGEGAVVATQDVDVPAIPAGESRTIEASATGSGITAWRYKRK